MKHFNILEFDSPDEPGSGRKMQKSTLSMVDKARDIAGIPFVINSGYRTKKHNKKVGGVSGSSHLDGFAVDIKCIGSSSRFKIVAALQQAGFTRIGIGRSFIHADNDPSKLKNLIWLYS